MRLGWDDRQPQCAARSRPCAESLGVKAITVHGRTRQQFYAGKADWRAVAEVKQAVQNSRHRQWRHHRCRNGARRAGAIGRRCGDDRTRAPMAGPGSPRLSTGPLTTDDDIAEPDLAQRLGIALATFHRHAALLWRRAGAENLPQTSGLVCGAGFMSCRCHRYAVHIKARLCQIDNAPRVESALGRTLVEFPPSNSRIRTYLRRGDMSAGFVRILVLCRPSFWLAVFVGVLMSRRYSPRSGQPSGSCRLRHSRRQPKMPPAMVGVIVITGTAGDADRRAARPHQSLRGVGYPAPGHRHHPEAAVRGRLDRQGGPGALSDRSRALSGDL